MDTSDSDAPHDHLGLEVLSPEECWARISETPIGRLAFIESGAPMVLPVVHGVLGRRIAFRSVEGGKLAAAQMGQPVAFEVDGWDAETRTGWSVVARGTAETAPEDSDVLDGLEVRSWLPATDDGTWIEVRVDEISGRRLGASAK